MPEGKGGVAHCCSSLQLGSKHERQSKMPYEQYEEEAEKIRAENAVLLKGFRKWLEESGIKEQTVKKHTGNVSFYINEYLLREDAARPQEGISALNGFFNWFFPRKAMWSNVTTTKETVASLKKFYRFLVDIGSVDATDYQWLLEEVKSEMPEWLKHYRHLKEW